MLKAKCCVKGRHTFLSRDVQGFSEVTNRKRTSLLAFLKVLFSMIGKCMP